MRNIALILSIFVCSHGFASEVVYKGMKLRIPDSWSIEYSVLYDDTGAKVGELISKDSWSYASGNDFVADFKKKFVDDPETTKFVSDGSKGDIYWVCRSGEYEDGKGGVGIWYIRTFWVKGPILVLYSHKNCEEKFEEALEIASTLREE